MSLTPGLYDLPVTRGVARALAALAAELSQVEDVDAHELPLVLARHLQRRLVHAFAAVPSDERATAAVDLANRLLADVHARLPRAGHDPDDDVVAPARKLLAVAAPAITPRHPERPGIALASSDLLVNGRHELSVGPELRRELASADRVDLLCSFLKWSGVRLLEEALRELLARRPGGLRVLTTAYMAATERRALDALVALGADVHVSYDTARTRLHAKAWLIHRDSGFSTAFVGSSNLSAAAMLDGLEWNVRLSQVDNGAILDKFAATFEQYWADSEFRPYDPDHFDEAVSRQIRVRTDPLLRLDVEPRPHQQEILDDLAAERARGHHRNLVVAATGTGKTIVAALDYRRLRAELPRARLLFVAHREEILTQSLGMFQVVLRDGAFGDLLVGGERSDRWEHVFASIQSLHADRLATLPADHFDVIIVDEFHHAAARTYEALLHHFAPRVLLGLTATPERADGRSVLDWFDGRTASELRLWKALDQGLLSPFHYFGVGGAPDISSDRLWVRGRYDLAQLGNVYTADHVFALRVAQEVERKVGDVHRMKALGFCVDIAHAEFMAGQFSERGIPARAVSARTPRAERRDALAALRDGTVNALFSVDLFNEGVDLPDVDTVLFLRPTESAVVFMQQLGRGLRRSRDKSCLTVLDFIGDAHRRFRFDARFRAILGGTRRSIQRQVEQGFPSLPSGCHIALDRQATKSVLDNLRHALGLGRRGLVDDLRQLVEDRGDVDLASFLAESGTDLEDLYGSSGGWCWTRLRREAGVSPPMAEDELSAAWTVQVERGFARLLHLDDPWRLAGLRTLLAADAPPEANADDALQRALFVLLGYMRRPLTALGQALDHLWAHEALRDELLQLLALLEDRARRLTFPLAPGPLAAPLHVHATYSLDEVMALVDERNTKGGVQRIQTGVYHLRQARTDLFFVTLEKSEQHYSPTTLYNDYPLSARRFHWESQSSCHAETSTGRRYTTLTRGADDQALLFVRQRRHDERGETMPYTLLGRCFYESHTGARPMQIVWSLEHPMPAAFYQEIKLAAG
ncbi:MAG: DUF3427 domain-containing protein [Deltaproteobacteria bacterium HGW-Deltaproteobacteria-14]|nr:MAG: DUF3427 domain-containing protein [Deltaproteobacteria bacterium HGW-Deltaproteobacteria-14]